MRRLSRMLGLHSLLIPVAVSSPAGAVLIHAGAPPPGFEQLAEPREVLVDLYFGGRKIGEAFATARPGFVRFRNPGEILAAIPDARQDPSLLAALTGDLPSHSDLICRETNAGACGSEAPAVAGIIYDEDRFRADIFVNPAYLRTKRQSEAYLPVPTTPPSLTSSFGVALSGSTGARTVYDLQNRTIAAFRNARVRLTSSVASKLGWVADDFVAEVDHRNWRYSGGLFWAPGLDFTGQRRILGVGAGTQFDTLVDRDSIRATPLILFLARPARVEILIDGRLLASGTYEVGNDELDTSALPDGAYSVLLRIHESGGAVREERRFFVKNAQVAPIGRPIAFAYAGLLANTRPNHPLSASRTPFYQLGGAWRLSRSVALDVSALGSDKKTLVELGGWLITPIVRIRAAALASSSNDKGLLFQFGSGASGPVNFTFDLRRIWTRRGEALFPLPSYVTSFDPSTPTPSQLGNGSYTQATGSLGYHLGPASISFVGSYRADRGLPADYSIGPSIDWPILNRNGVQIMVDANAQRTSTTTAAFAGFQLMLNSGHFSVQGSAGAATLSERDNPSSDRGRPVGSVSAQYSTGSDPSNSLSIEAGADRNIDSSTVRAGAILNNRLGQVRADALHNLEGRGGTQYGLTLQSAAAGSVHGVTLGGNELEESAVIISIDGDSGTAFDVLVNESVRGRVRRGQRLSLFLPAYRAYKVRLLPTQAAAVAFDASTREVTLYPGDVQTLRWTTQSYFTTFGQAVRPDGVPIANALVRSSRGVSETDSNGYFQIDVTRNDRITVGEGEGVRCRAELARLSVKNDYAPIGKVVCQ